MKAPAQARGDFRIFIRHTSRRAMRVGVITSGLHFPAQARGGAVTSILQFLKYLLRGFGIRLSYQIF